MLQLLYFGFGARIFDKAWVSLLQHLRSRWFMLIVLRPIFLIFNETLLFSNLFFIVRQLERTTVMKAKYCWVLLSFCWNWRWETDTHVPKRVRFFIPLVLWAFRCYDDSYLFGGSRRINLPLKGILRRLYSLITTKVEGILIPLRHLTRLSWRDLNSNWTLTSMMNYFFFEVSRLHLLPSNRILELHDYTLFNLLKLLYLVLKLPQLLKLCLFLLLTLVLDLYYKVSFLTPLLLNNLNLLFFSLLCFDPICLDCFYELLFNLLPTNDLYLSLLSPFDSLLLENLLLYLFRPLIFNLSLLHNSYSLNLYLYYLIDIKFFPLYLYLLSLFFVLYHKWLCLLKLFNSADRFRLRSLQRIDSALN